MEIFGFARTGFKAIVSNGGVEVKVGVKVGKGVGVFVASPALTSILKAEAWTTWPEGGLGVGVEVTVEVLVTVGVVVGVFVGDVVIVGHGHR